jgi:hypothetical protein
MVQQSYVQGHGVYQVAGSTAVQGATQWTVSVVFHGLKLDAPQQMRKSLGASVCRGSRASSACKRRMSCVVMLYLCRLFSGLQLLQLPTWGYCVGTFQSCSCQHDMTV